MHETVSHGNNRYMIAKSAARPTASKPVKTGGVGTCTGDIAAKIAARRLINSSDCTNTLVWQWLAAKGVDYESVCRLPAQSPATRCRSLRRGASSLPHSARRRSFRSSMARWRKPNRPPRLVAFRPRAVRNPLSQAAVLGIENALNKASFVYGPCRLWRDPLRWLREGCSGGVVLDSRLARPILDRAPGPFAAEELQHGIELLAALAVRRDRLFVPDHRCGMGVA